MRATKTKSKKFETWTKWMAAVLSLFAFLQTAAPAAQAQNPVVPAAAQTQSLEVAPTAQTPNLVVASLATASSHTSQNQPIIPTAQTQKQVVVLGIDDTGSYALRSKAISISQQIIAQLQPGDVLYARRITDSSYGDKGHIFQVEIPQALGRPSNQMDRRAWLNYQASLKRVKLVKLQAMTKLSRLEPSRAKKTDIYGFVAAAAERFELEEQGGAEKLMIICSDMSDNVGRKVRPKLPEVKILVVGWQAGDDPAKSLRLKQYWTKQLTNHCDGQSIKFLPPEIKVRLRP